MKDKYEMVLTAEYITGPDFRLRTTVEHATASDEQDVLVAVDRAFRSIIDRESSNDERPSASPDAIDYLHSIARKKVVDEMRSHVIEPFTSVSTHVAFDPRDFAVKCGIPDKLLVDIVSCDSKETEVLFVKKTADGEKRSYRKPSFYTNGGPVGKCDPALLNWSAIKDAEDELPDVLETIEPTETASDDEPADFREIVHVNIVSDTKETFDTNGAAKTTETEPTDFRKIASFLRHVAERLENGDADLENAVLAAKKSLDKVISASQTEIS